ncbi:MAG TPA: SpoIID/LytB domain-containing protein [Solirubrobacteraceae bacterium]|nr:SpoIID/LytB domain-containing protein [Solirubrobacteraceae bacterium]
MRTTRALLTAAVLLTGSTAAARAASTFDIRGGGDGHGIGMSQYGAYGYALHGADYTTILAHYYQGTALSTTNPGQTVRVLLSTGRASFSGAASVSGSATRLTPGATYTVKTAGAKLTISTSAGKTVGTFASPLTVTAPTQPAEPLTAPGLGSYRGSLQFSPAGGGVQTVNAVGLDDYVRGVVAAEMPSSWATAALQAQAVAARTYAITTTVGGNGYDLYSDTRSQMYGGVKAETASTNAAVAATGGQIVTYDGKPAVTYFFASSGGHTESVQNVWAGATPEPWLRGVPDPYDNAGQNPYHSWGSQMSLAAAARKLGRLVKGSLVGIAVTRRGVSPRIVQAQVVGTRGTTTVSGTQLQASFGLDDTWATFTSITTTDPSGKLSGSVFPAPAAGSVTIQAQTAGTWRTVGQAPVSPSGAYSTRVPSGRYRLVDGGLDGPVVTVP